MRLLFRVIPLLLCRHPPISACSIDSLLIRPPHSPSTIKFWRLLLLRAYHCRVLPLYCKLLLLSCVQHLAQMTLTDCSNGFHFFELWHIHLFLRVYYFIHLAPRSHAHHILLLLRFASSPFVNHKQLPRINFKYRGHYFH